MTVNQDLTTHPVALDRGHALTGPHTQMGVVALVSRLARLSIGEQHLRDECRTSRHIKDLVGTAWQTLLGFGQASILFPSLKNTKGLWTHTDRAWKPFLS
jgi:hypothetical protein